MVDPGATDPHLLARRERAGLPVLLRILASLLGLFVVLVGLELHGFSFARWHDLIDGSPASEVWLGEARYIRVDDWMVRIPMALAQSAHDPAFPVVNTNIGLGQNMLLPLAVPVLHPVTIYRPTLWGYFLGDETGLAWAWWSQSLGLLAVWLAVFFVVTRGQLALSCAGALLLFFAPYFQIFSFTYATLAIYAGLAWLACLGVLLARGALGILASGLILGFAGAAFVLVLYPAFQVGIGYLSLIVVGGCVWDRRSEIDWRSQRALRLSALGLAVLVAGAGLASFFVAAGDAVESMRNTAYPGGRISTGGEEPFWMLAMAHLGGLLQIENYRPVESIANAVSFLYFFPVVLLTMAVRGVGSWRRLDPMLLGLGLFCVGTELYRLVGFPEWLSRLTLMSFVPGYRAIVALGLADALLLLRFLSLSRQGEGELGGWRAAAIAAVFGLWLALAARAIHGVFPETQPSMLGLLVVVNVALAWLVSRCWRPAVVIAAAAALLAFSTAWFNPLARGGAAFVRENPLARAIIEIDEAEHGETVWATIGNSDRGNLFRMLGVASVGGANMLPQLELWRRIDRKGRAEEAYNRYAHVGFSVGATRFRLSSHHGFMLRLDPEQGTLSTLGITHLLVSLRNSSRWRSYWDAFEPERVVGDHRLFALPLKRREPLAE